MNTVKLIPLIIVICSCLFVSNSIAQDKAEYQRKVNLIFFNWPGVIGLGVNGEVSVVGAQVRFKV